MRITDIRKSMVYYIDTNGEYPNSFRTNSTGTYWETSYGTSWEEQEPPEEIIKEFQAYLYMRNSANEFIL